MKAVVVTKPGKPEVLQIEERNTPVPAAHEVLIRVRAAGVNRPDLAQRVGKYPAPDGVPADIPGLEVSGTIEALGETVKNWEIGDQVCALIAGGGYAEYAVAPASQCLTIPEGVSLEEAASLPETFFTVWNNMFYKGHFQAGDKVLVHGGSSGIGVAAIQMITALDGIVFTTAGTEEKCRICEHLGARIAVNYRKDDFEEKIREQTGSDGIDIILDMVGGAYTLKNIRLLANKGRLIMINAMQNKIGEVDLIRVMKKELVLTGSTLRPKSIAYKGQLATQLMGQIWPLFPDRIKPLVHTAFPLAEAYRAHELMESSTHIGKILLFA
ncbi:putative NAD(P)H quinone oxidoreductase, PIG3 family [Cyclobacterium lianum]|uniref:Putative NAD(P)H quinone oxidoreductase, PIG3 family n=1 Tax=Cyclobacterium lianum TaxID=388280 RepID=A0A1M7NWZ7_9BACT|nr:NAD(P)H-quinone oxidoreductase [Cyclobacterium lianum]SHN08306.1 putative NAD(P)H quinone oxidoreductase, PIG3 family [Cyclobacterium lianum]